MQKFLQWLDDHALLDPLEKALGIVGVILFFAWGVVLILAALFVLPILALTNSAWWLLAYIPLLVLVTATLMLYYYIDEKGGLF